MIMKLLFGASILCTSLVSYGNEAEFKTADDLFSTRANSIENTQAARAAYLKIAETASGADLERAVVGALRTSIYEGEALTDIESGKDRRREIFTECYDKIAPMISPEKLGYETPAYYYFSASCMAYYAQVSGTLENLKNYLRLNRTLDNGLASQGGDIYEGGGIKRVKAAVKSNPKAKPIPGGLYNPEAALQLINEAIASEAYPSNSEGKLFCENYRRKVNVLTELQRIDEAKTVGNSAIEEFTFLLDLGEIPSRLEAETIHCVNVITEEIAAL